MKQYHDLLNLILEKGKEKTDRTGVGTINIFGHQMRFDLQEGFPLVTTKKVNFKAVVYELLWFLRGDVNIQYLVNNNTNIWNEWPYDHYLKSHQFSSDPFDYKGSVPPSKDYTPYTQKEFIERIKTDNAFARRWGSIGRGYGFQWRNFGGKFEYYYNWSNNKMTRDSDGIDQIANLIDGLKSNPESRRHVLSAWNPKDLKHMLLPPCHCLCQFYVEDNKLSCQLYQRSCDVFLGVPFNIASYALLTHILANMCGYEVGDFVWTGGDVHIYSNHIEQVKAQLSREERSLPTLKINKQIEGIEGIFNVSFEDFTLEGYDPHPFIKAEVAV